MKSFFLVQLVFALVCAWPPSCPTGQVYAEGHCCPFGHYYSYEDGRKCIDCRCNKEGILPTPCVDGEECDCKPGFTGKKCWTRINLEKSIKFEDWVWRTGPSEKKYWRHVTVECDGYCIIEGLRLVTSSDERADVDMYASERKWAKTSSEFKALGWVFCKGEGSSLTSEKCDYKGTLGTKSFHVLFRSKTTFIDTEFKFKVANYKSVSNTEPTPYVFKEKTLDIINKHWITQSSWYNYEVMITIHCTGYCEIRNIYLRTYYTYRANIDMWGSDAPYEQNSKTYGYRTLGNEFCKYSSTDRFYDKCKPTGKEPKKVEKIYLLLLSKKEFYDTDVIFEAVNYDSWTVSYVPYYSDD